MNQPESYLDVIHRWALKRALAQGIDPKDAEVDVRPGENELVLTVVRKEDKADERS